MSSSISFSMKQHLNQTSSQSKKLSESVRNSPENSDPKNSLDLSRASGTTHEFQNSDLECSWFSPVDIETIL